MVIQWGLSAHMIQLLCILSGGFGMHRTVDVEVRTRPGPAENTCAGNAMFNYRYLSQSSSVFRDT